MSHVKTWFIFFTMIILTQDSECIYDVEKSSSLYANEEGIIYLLNYTGELAFPLGKYSNRERAKEIISEIFTLYDCVSKYEMPIV